MTHPAIMEAELEARPPGPQPAPAAATAATPPSRGSTDFMTEEGARELKRRIDQFWQRKLAAMGRNPAMVSTWTENQHAAAGQHAVWGVRSNLIRGWPLP